MALAQALVMRHNDLWLRSQSRVFGRQTANAVGDLMTEIQHQENTILLLATHSQALVENAGIGGTGE